MVDVDVVVVGAGFAGLRTLHTFRSQGLEVAVLEAGDDVGGVWQWNRYPGARCDVESYDYSYSFSSELEQEWRWSERYATQPEILRYIQHVVDRFDLSATCISSRRSWRRPGTRRQRAGWCDTASGQQWRGRFLVMATGQLSTTKTPSLPGPGARSTVRCC